MHGRLRAWVHEDGLKYGSGLFKLIPSRRNARSEAEIFSALCCVGLLTGSGQVEYGAPVEWAFLSAARAKRAVAASVKNS